MLDYRGARSLLTGTTSREITVGLEQVDDQWRLPSVPDGIFLSEAAFETLYAPARLYFLVPRREHLVRSEEHTPELQSRGHLVCRLLLEKTKNANTVTHAPPAH